MAENNHKITANDFGIETSKLSKEEQDKFEKSLSVLIDAARTVINEHKQTKQYYNVIMVRYYGCIIL